MIDTHGFLSFAGVLHQSTREKKKENSFRSGGMFASQSCASGFHMDIELTLLTISLQFSCV
jgi:hypothetical protein